MESTVKVWDLAVDQVRRLSSQDFFKADRVVVNELARTLIKHADSAEHLEKMVTTWIDRTRIMLHPSDVRNLADETANRQEIPEPCAVCAGCDFIPVVVKGVDMMARCNCARGLRLIDLEKQARKRRDIATAEADFSTGEDLLPAHSGRKLPE